MNDIDPAAAQAHACENRRVVLLATGGTIAGHSASASDPIDYAPAQYLGEDLIRDLPEVAAIATVIVEQVDNIASMDVDDDVLRVLRSAIVRHLADDAVSGIVISHGTSTLEETALYLDLTLRTPKPIVVLGAMRPKTALSADGPMNLLQAFSLAASDAGRHRGVLMVANDRIGTPLYTTKCHTHAVDAFQSGDAGALGIFVGIEPLFFHESSRVTGLPYFDVGADPRLARVDIVYSHQGEAGAELLEASVRGGAEGLVVAATGNGTVSTALEQSIGALMARGVPVVRSSHVGFGFVSPKQVGIAAGFYNPQKARVLLRLALADGADCERIRSYFHPF